nr:hypothetical protein [Tanacetum cinerariifolium]
MKAVPLPLTGNYMPPSNIPDIDESQMVYLHLIKYCDLHEQRFAKRNAEGKGILGRKPTGKPVNPNRPKPVSTGQQNPVSAGLPNLVSAEQQNTVSAGWKRKKIEETMNLIFLENKPFVAGTSQAWVFDIDYLTDSLNYSRVNSSNLTVGFQGATLSNAGSQEADSDSDDEPDVLIIHSTPTLVVPIVDEATTQNDADRLGLAFPSLKPILGVGTASIGSFVSAGSTPHVFAGSTPPMSPCASPISTDRHSISADKSYVSPGRPTGSTGRPVSAGRPSGSADRTPVPAGRILGKFTASASSERFPRVSNVENLDIHDGLKIFDCPKSGIFTSSSYDEEFAGPDAHNLEHSLDVRSTITKRNHNIHPTSQVLGDINSLVQTRLQVKHTDPDWVEATGRNGTIQESKSVGSCHLT